MKNFLGLLAIVIAIVSYIPYIRDVIRGKTRPHAFSWFIWGLLTGIAFFAQAQAHGGAGAWATGFTAVIAFVIFGFALRWGKRNIVTIDWFFLAGALAALGLWAATNNPVWSVILITLIDMLAFVPTFRKSFHRPDEETVMTYTLSALKFMVALLALGSYSVTTVLYPLSLVITNSLFVLMVSWRSKQLSSLQT
jgi:hypothetical protein